MFQICGWFKELDKKWLTIKISWVIQNFQILNIIEEFRRNLNVFIGNNKIFFNFSE